MEALFGAALVVAMMAGAASAAVARGAVPGAISLGKFRREGRGTGEKVGILLL